MGRARPRRGAAVAAQPVGLFGGSFDPPHLGHVALVRAALAALDLPKLWVVPAGQPVHRRLSGCADAVTRLDWLTRIFAGWPRVKVVDWEVRSAAPTPTIATLRLLKRRFSQLVPLLLVGEDAFADLPSWVDYPAHRELCSVAVFPRSGITPVALPGWRSVAPEDWRRQPAVGCVMHVKAELPDISATEIRARAAAGKSLAGLVPAVVQAAIAQHYRKEGHYGADRS